MKKKQEYVGKRKIPIGKANKYVVRTGVKHLNKPVCKLKDKKII